MMVLRLLQKRAWSRMEDRFARPTTVSGGHSVQCVCGLPGHLHFALELRGFRPPSRSGAVPGLRLERPATRCDTRQAQRRPRVRRATRRQWRRGGSEKGNFLAPGMTKGDEAVEHGRSMVFGELFWCFDCLAWVFGILSPSDILWFLPRGFQVKFIH